MSQKLDRARDFTSFYPPHEGASFEQDGVPFDSQGNALGKAKAKPAPRSEGSAVETGGGGAQNGQGGDEELSLETLPSNFMKLKKLVKERTGVVVENKAEAHAALERAGLV